MFAALDVSVQSLENVFGYYVYQEYFVPHSIDLLVSGKD